MEQALAYVCCSAEEGKTKVQRYCRKIYELGYVPICPQYSFSPFLDDGDAEDMQAMRRMSHQILRRCRMVVVCGKETTGTMNTEISMADRLHIICTTLDGLSKIKGKRVIQRNNRFRGDEAKCDWFCKHSVWISKRTLGRTPIPHTEP